MANLNDFQKRILLVEVCILSFNPSSLLLVSLVCYFMSQYHEIINTTPYYKILYYVNNQLESFNIIHHNFPYNEAGNSG